MVLRKKLSIWLISGLLLPVLAIGPVFAQTETTEETDTTAPTLDERIAERKAARKTRLTAAQQTRLRGRCRAAQVILGKYSERLTHTAENRASFHERISNKLNDIVAKAGDNADTTDLKASIETLNSKTDAFAASLETYQEAVDDLIKLDCVDDPTAFQATLDTIRAQRAELLKSAADIRGFLRDTVKPQLQSLRTALKETKDAE